MKGVRNEQGRPIPFDAVAARGLEEVLCRDHPLGRSGMYASLDSHGVGQG